MAGRPPNPVSPEQVQERELTAWSKTSEKVRARIEKELEFFEKLPEVVGAASANFADHLAVCDMLMKLANAVSTIMDRGLRIAATKPAGQSDDPEAIERELLGT